MEQILDKFSHDGIKTERLYTDIKLFSFRLNDAKQVICTVDKHEDEERLVILEVLTSHDYHRSPYVRGDITAIDFKEVEIIKSRVEVEQLQVQSSDDLSSKEKSFFCKTLC